MAVNAPTLRLRFRFNQQSGRAFQQKVPQKAANNFAAAIIESVGLEYAEKYYDDLKTKISTTMSDDVRKEVEHIARQYKKFIVGSEANQRSTRGELTSFAATEGQTALNSQGLKSFNIGGSRWASRNRQYLSDKMKKKSHQRWFEYDGVLGEAMRKGSVWLSIFGPISIKVIRTKSVSVKEGSRKRVEEPLDFNGLTRSVRTAKLFGESGVGKFSVARIEVRALGRVTPAMLPALVSGKADAPIPADGRKTGLLNLVTAYDRSLAHGLGSGQQVPYRPTLEPFLAFALTRSIPSAVFNRVAQGLNQRDLTGGKTMRYR